MATRVIGRAAGLVLATLLGAMLFGRVVGAAGSEQASMNNAPMGADLYRMYCASCHGVTARGDGPLAASMRRTPPNLTEIAKRHKGTYPGELVFKIIDGRQRVPGHGGPDMPVWGDAFMRTSDATDESSVRFRIQALVDYLETIQARDTSE
jgi:mono/diheme cytochrome c family protein